jgi:hypothetical protein
METLNVGLFPRRAGLDVETFDALSFEPVLDSFGDKLRSVITADKLRCALGSDDPFEDIDGIKSPYRIPVLNRQRLLGVFVNQSQ